MRGGLPVLSWKVILQGNLTSNRTCLISTVILIMCFYDILNILCTNNLKSTLAALQPNTRAFGEDGKGKGRGFIFIKVTEINVFGYWFGESQWYRQY